MSSLYTYNNYQKHSNPYQNVNQKNFDRNLETKDITGAKPNTLISPALKNLQKAKQYQQINEEKMLTEQYARQQEAEELEIQYDKIPHQYTQQPQYNQQQEQYYDPNSNYYPQEIQDKFQSNVANFFRGTTPDTYSSQIYDNQNLILNYLQKKEQENKAQEYEKRLDMIKSENFANNLGSFYDEQGQNQLKQHQTEQQQRGMNQNQKQQMQEFHQQQQYAPIQQQDSLSEIDRLKQRIAELEVSNQQANPPQQQFKQFEQAQTQKDKQCFHQQQRAGFPVESGKLQLTPNVCIQQKQMGRYSPTSLSFAGKNELIAQENETIAKELQNVTEANNQLLQDEKARKQKELDYLNQLKKQVNQQQASMFMTPNITGKKQVHRFGSGMKSLYS